MSERINLIHENNISSLMHFSDMCITNDIDELRNIHRDIRNDQKPKIRTLPLVVKTDYPRANIGDGPIVMPLIPPAPRGRDMPARPKIFSFEG